MSGNTIGDCALQKVGCPYKYGAAGPSSFDCSGLVQWCHTQAGISVPRTASAQAASSSGTKLSSWSEFKKGDVIFFDTEGGGKVTHSAISLGGDVFVHAPKPGENVKQVTANEYYWKKSNVFKGGRRFW